MSIYKDKLVTIMYEINDLYCLAKSDCKDVVKLEASLDRVIKEVNSITTLLETY